ncbi:MAG TPA: hypothetical protein VF937_08025, partial [Chloroflexota bacterium]
MSSFFSTGGVVLVILVSTVLTIPSSLGLVWLYQRSVRAAMALHAASRQSLSPSPPAPRVLVAPAAALTFREFGPASAAPADSVASLTLRRALGGPWRAAAIYTLAGLVYALLTALLLLTAAGTAVLPQRLSVVTLAYAWPVVLTVNLLTASRRSIQIRNAAIYVAVLLVLIGFDVRDAAVLWLVTAGPPSVLLLAFMYPKVRTIGPLVFTFMTIGVFGANLLLVPLDITGVQRLVASVSVAIGLDVTAWIVAAAILGFAIAAVLGWGALSWVRRRYDAKQVSDQSLSIDAIWLVFTVYNATDIASDGAGWGAVTLATFIVFRVLAGIGFALSSGHGAAPQNYRLLFLRVFGSAARSTRLMNLIGARWRYAGSIQLITGTDLATSTLEPHEFLEFVRGRLTNRHIRDRESLERQVGATDLRPDFDGRFRINEFLCHEDTWQATLSRLVGSSDVVLMDLRGFSPANQGCVFELQALVNEVPLARVITIVDGTTDVGFLHGV